MHSILTKSRPAQEEVHKTARDLDLIEVPKRAQLDRLAEHNKQFPPAQDPAQEIVENH